MNSASYSTKEQKVFYLKKIITLTSSILNEEIEAKPNKIVAGVEPENTNYLLQGNNFSKIVSLIVSMSIAIYKVAVSGEDSMPYVQKVNLIFVNNMIKM